MKKLHFIAIGGSAMHNLAIALRRKGYEISGSDDEIFEPSRTRLEREGILPEKIGWFPEKINHSVDAVILGMHARLDNPELVRAQELGLKVYSYPEYLYEQSKNKKRVVIGGSHGKTTITSMILHVLNAVGVESDFMVGAQLEGFDCMVRLSDTANLMVMEGDEYLTSPIDQRPKFHLYKPHIAVISGIGWDHVNVFPTFENYLEQFRIFIDTIEPDGCLIVDKTDIEALKIAQESKHKFIGYEAHPYKVVDGITNLILEDGLLVPLHIFGKHNMLNISAAKNVCEQLGVSRTDFYRAIASFRGAVRRLELIAVKDENYAFRDFAHAPSKVKATVEAVKELYPNHLFIAVFELHTYSSLNEMFIDNYKYTLDCCDKAFVFYDPHVVSLKKLPTITPERIKQAFGRDDIEIVSSKQELLAYFAQSFKQPFVTLFMSSGNFNGLTSDEITKTLFC
jgi:UDP-N-acetylmuramate: L-alanyl-gamma-D-glutamyl-meso-diaminopimelate ligase